VEDLDALVAGIGCVDITLRIDHNRIHRSEHSVCGSFRTPRLDEYALAVEFCDARIAHSIGDKNITRGIPGNVGAAVEYITLSAGAVTGCGSRGNGYRLRLSAEQHEHASGRIKLHHITGHLVDDPDVVLRIDTNLLRKHESINSLADLAN